jgi:hypothetical protein
MRGVGTGDHQYWMNRVVMIPGDIKMAKDVVSNDTTIDWAILVAKANMAARRSSLS